MPHSFANVSTSPVEVDGVTLAPGEKVHNLDGYSDAARALIDRGDLWPFETPVEFTIIASENPTPDSAATPVAPEPSAKRTSAPTQPAAN